MERRRKNKPYRRAAGWVRVSFLMLCIAGLSVAWFGQGTYEGYAARYKKSFEIRDNGGMIKNYIASDLYTQDAEWIDDEKTAIKTINFTSIKEDTDTLNFDLSGLYPGQRIYFKTEVSNTRAKELKAALCLSGIYYDRIDSLNRAIRFVEIQPTGYEINYAKAAEKVTQDGKDMYCISSAQISDTFTVPAGTTEEPGMTTIYWCIEIDGNEADSTCENAQITIGQMTLLQKD